MPGGYGAVSRQVAPRRQQAALLGVAISAIVAAFGLVVALTIVGGPASRRTELTVYQTKYRDVHPGGVWMDCLKCRHNSDKCHPTPSESEGEHASEINACPPHTGRKILLLLCMCPDTTIYVLILLYMSSYYMSTGMTTVLMRRNGKVETKWIDVSSLKCALKKIKDSMTPPAAEEEEPAEEEEEDTEEGPLHTITYLFSYYYMCPIYSILRCVRMLSYYHTYVCLHTTILYCVRPKLLYMWPHATKCMSSYCYIFVLTSIDV
jgi:hypothetical protein